MTKIYIFLLIILMSATGSAAEQKISVVDFDKVWRDSKAALQVRTHIENMRLEFQKEVIKLEGTLRAQEDDLHKQEESLTPAEYQDLRTQFDLKVKSVQKAVQKKKTTLEKTFQESMTLIRKTLDEAVATIAKSEAADIVLSKTQVAFHGDNFDLTLKVLSHLDKTLPQIDMQNIADAAA